MVGRLAIEYSVQLNWTEEKDGKMVLNYIVGSSNGRTAGFGPVNLGSSPSPTAILKNTQ